MLAVLGSGANRAACYRNFSIKTYLLDFWFSKPATAYGWFMGYIVTCYLLFYAVKKLVKDSRMQMLALFGVFAIWFVLESAFFANPDMPFLRARQMLSFPVGVLLAANKNQIERTLTKTKNILILMGGGYSMHSLHGNNAAECG